MSRSLLLISTHITSCEPVRDRDALGHVLFVSNPYHVQGYCAYQLLRKLSFQGLPRVELMGNPSAALSR